MKIVFICSTNGSVIKKALSTSLLADYQIEFVSDRQCGIIEFASANNFENKVLESKTGTEFSNLLAQEYPAVGDVLFVSFYTRILTSSFLDVHAGRVINFHPSILPACPGMDGFGDTLKSGSLFIGSTVHFIDEGVDTGVPILQAAFPRNFAVEIPQLRHRVFLQQVISLIQVADWFKTGRLPVDRDNKSTNFSYKVSEFSPNLDDNYFDLFKKWLFESDLSD